MAEPPPQPEIFVFDPEADITAFEVATIIAKFFEGMDLAMNERGLKRTPEAVRRHFKSLEDYLRGHVDEPANDS